jgi:hypothetical protein
VISTAEMVFISIVSIVCIETGEFGVEWWEGEEIRKKFREKSPKKLELFRKINGLRGST